MLRPTTSSSFSSWSMVFSSKWELLNKAGQMANQSTKIAQRWVCKGTEWEEVNLKHLTRLFLDAPVIPTNAPTYFKRQFSGFVWYLKHSQTELLQVVSQKNCSINKLKSISLVSISSLMSHFMNPRGSQSNLLLPLWKPAPQSEARGRQWRIISCIWSLSPSPEDTEGFVSISSFISGWQVVISG